MKSSVIIAGILFAVSGLNADVLIDVKKQSDIRTVKYAKLQQDGSFLSAPNTWVVLKKRIAVTPDKGYRFSAEVRLPDNVQQKTKVRLGYMTYGEGGKSIHVSSVKPVKGTETELTAPAGKKERILKVKDASKWNTKISSQVVFDIDPTGNMRDIPNHDLIGRVKNVRKTDTGWEVEMRNAIGTDLAAGTAIRQHEDGRSGVLSNAFTVSQEWTPIVFNVRPGITADGSRTDQWYPGVTAAAPMLMVSQPVLFRNMKVEDVKAE